MQFVWLLIPIFVFVLIRGILDQRAKERSERTRLLEEALKNPAIDRATLTTLAHQLTGVRPYTAERRTGTGVKLLLVLGWLTLFSGLGIWVLGEMIACTDASAAGVLTSIVGFGFVTYPFALRELETRRPAA